MNAAHKAFALLNFQTVTVCGSEGAGYGSNNSVTLLALKRSIFISGTIDFHLIKKLNFNKFKEKEH